MRKQHGLALEVVRALARSLLRVTEGDPRDQVISTIAVPVSNCSHINRG